MPTRTGGQRQHNTVLLFVTHDLSVVSEIADRVLVLQRGRIVESGTKQVVLSNPQHP